MTRHATLPLNSSAVKAADREFAENHPELGGRPLSATDPAQAELRKEWMSLYLDHGGETLNASDKPPSSPVQGCASHQSGGVTPEGSASSSDEDPPDGLTDEAYKSKGRNSGKKKPSKPCAGQGLTDPKCAQQFGKDMRKLQHDWHGLSVNDREERLENLLNSRLQSVGAAKITIQPDAAKGPGNAAFSPARSVIRVSEADLKADPMPGDLPDTVYHESRHAEQSSLIARKRAAEIRSQTEDQDPPPTDDRIAKQISDETGVSNKISNAATKDKNPLTPGSPRYACAAALEKAAISKKGREHQNQVENKVESQGKMMESLNADQKKMNAAQATLDDPKKDIVAKARALSDYNMAKDDQIKTLNENGFKTTHEASAAYQKTYQAYRDLPVEGDGWDAGAAGQKAFDHAKPVN